MSVHHSLDHQRAFVSGIQIIPYRWSFALHNRAVLELHFLQINLNWKICSKCTPNIFQQIVRIQVTLELAQSKTLKCVKHGHQVPRTHCSVLQMHPTGPHFLLSLTRPVSSVLLIPSRTQMPRWPSVVSCLLRH